MPEYKIPVAIEAENGSETLRTQILNQDEQGETIGVHRKRIESVTIYDVTEAELTILEKGSDASVWFNVLMASLSIAVSFFIALVTVDWGEAISLTRLVFTCVTIIMAVVSVVCFTFWLRGKGEHKRAIKTIRERSTQCNY